MVTKIYKTVWSIVAIVALILFLSGNFTSLAAVAFGFVIFGLVFAGMMIVLPHEVSHPKPKKIKVAPEASIERKPATVIAHARELAVNLFSSDEGVEFRKPKYH